jgi:hypothetical protein
MMGRLCRSLAVALVTAGALAAPAAAQDPAFKMEKLFTSGNQATNSDLAFWGDYAFVGYYTGGAGFPPGSGPRGGVRIFDISDPASPSLVRDFACDGAQNDPILWDPTCSCWRSTPRWRARTAARHGCPVALRPAGRASASSR